MSAPAGARRRASGGRPGGLELFRVAGIRVRADASWFVIFALVLVSLSTGTFPAAHPDSGVLTYWLAGLATTLLFFGSLILHELSHALVATRAGLEVPRITLFLFGGVSEMRDEPPTPAVELRVAAVGPLASFALAGVFALAAWALPSTPWVPDAVAVHLAWINLALGTFNLLPGYPLDGGRVLRALVWWRTGSIERATHAASVAGRGFGLGLAFLGALQLFQGNLLGGVWLILIGLFLRALASRGYEAQVARSALGHATVEDAMTPGIRLHVVRPEATLQELVDDGFLTHGHRSFPVARDGEPLGLVTLAGVRAVDRAEWPRRTVAEAMTPLSDELVIQDDAPLTEALGRVGAGGAERLLVLHDGHLAGLLSARDLQDFVEVRSQVGPRDGAE